MINSPNRNRVEDTVRHHWATVLEMPAESVTAASDFFADGGDSLLAAELVAAVGDDVRADIDIAQLFLDASFAALVDAATTAHDQARTGAEH
ncbi:phosphopantetheine-binding protein [Streptomyces sp. NBC_01231]|nr:phosphopantetheine-binding protein [Streptomyces sp. NBC_01231]